MATVAQITANRLNAQRSTGPRTEEGKATSRFNALKHGLEARSLVIPGEDPAELEALALDYLTQFNPVGPLERYLVDSLLRADWDRRRYARVEGALLRSGPDAMNGKAAQMVFRRLAYAERLYFNSLKELRRAQKERLAQEEDPEPGEAGTTPAPRSQPPAPVPQPPAPASRPAAPTGFVPPIRT